MSKFGFARLSATWRPLAPRPARPAACIEKFHNSDEANNRTTMDAKIHKGLLFITRCLLFLLRMEATCSTGTAMPEATFARNSCDLAKTASKSQKAPGV